MSALNMLAQQPAHGLGEAGRRRAVLAGSKKKSQIGGNPNTLVQFTLEKKDNLSYRWLLATTLRGRHFMKEGVYFLHRDCVEISSEFKKMQHLPTSPSSYGVQGLSSSPVSQPAIIRGLFPPVPNPLWLSSGM